MDDQKSICSIIVKISNPGSSTLHPNRKELPVKATPSSYSFVYSNISPGWQSSASHIASSVENLIALILPFFILERLTFDTPTLSDSSFSEIFLSAMTLSSLSMICPISISLKCLV